MAEVKWIKIVTDIFDDEKILLIEGMPSADEIIVIWFKLLCLAGKNNNSGVFVMNDKIPYTDEMLATIFRRDVNTVRLALQTFERFVMIEVVNNIITIPNWNKHQTLDSYEKKKERDKLYQKGRREQQKLLACRSMSGDSVTDSSPYVAVSDSDIEEDIEVDIDISTTTKSKSSALPRHAHGEYGWVKLTDKEHSSLVERYGKALVDYYIQYIDESAQISGNKNKWRDWNRVIQKAIREKWGKPPTQAAPTIKVFEGY